MNDSIDIVDAPTWQFHVEYLQRYFFENAGAKCLVWVNPAQYDLFENFSPVQERRVQMPIQHPRFDVALGPYLVPLDLAKSADADVLRTSVESAWNAWGSEQLLAGHGQPVAGWVETSAEPKALARHWAAHCHLHRRGGLNKLLRFHDPSVREWLWPVLTPMQRSALLGPATSLLSIGRSRTFNHHRCDLAGVSGSHDKSVSERHSSLTLENGQWEQVEEYATVHAAWVAWSGTQPDGAGRRLATGWEQGIFAALSHTSGYGVLDAQDRELFALHALQLNGDFHVSPRMQPVWAKTRTGEFYGSAIEEVFERPANQLHTYLFSA